MLFTGGSPPQAEIFGDFEVLKCGFVRGKARRRREKIAILDLQNGIFKGESAKKWSKFGHWPKLCVPINPPLDLAEILSEGGGVYWNDTS